MKTSKTKSRTGIRVAIAAVSAFMTIAPAYAQGAMRGRSATVAPYELTADSVIFRYKADNAKEVTVKPSWVGRSEAEQASCKMTKVDGIWTASFARPAPEMYTYSFSVDGQNNGRSSTSILIDGGHADYYRQCAHPGNISYVWYYSATNDMIRRMTVYTPWGYDPKDTSIKYPVLYLLHGAGGNEEDWLNQGYTAKIMDNLIEQKLVVPMIVVMPNGNPSQYAASSLGIPAKKDIKKYPSNFDNYDSMAADIVPFIDKTYNVIESREGRAVAGLSMGGGQSFFIGFRNIDIFANIGIFSAGLLGGSGAGMAAFDPEKSMPGMVSNPSKYNRLDCLYLSCGESDNRNSGIKAYYDQVCGLGYNNVFYESYAGNHEWKVWRQSLISFVQKIFK